MQNFSQKNLGIDSSSTSKTWFAIACGPRGESNWNIWNNGARPLDEFPKPIALYIIILVAIHPHTSRCAAGNQRTHTPTPRESFLAFQSIYLERCNDIMRTSEHLAIWWRVDRELHGCGRIFLMVYVSGAAFRPVYYTRQKRGFQHISLGPGRASRCWKPIDQIQSQKGPDAVCLCLCPSYRAAFEIIILRSAHSLSCTTNAICQVISATSNAASAPPHPQNFAYYSLFRARNVRNGVNFYAWMHARGPFVIEFGPAHDTKSVQKFCSRGIWAGDTAARLASVRMCKFLGGIVDPREILWCVSTGELWYNLSKGRFVALTFTFYAIYQKKIIWNKFFTIYSQWGLLGNIKKNLTKLLNISVHERKLCTICWLMSLFSAKSLNFRKCRLQFKFEVIIALRLFMA